MLPKEILEIITKYQNSMNDEVNNINSAINEIIHQLKLIRANLSSELSNLINNDAIDEREDEIHQDSKTLRNYINSIKFIDTGVNAEISEELTPTFETNVRLYLVSDDICPFENVKMKPHSVRYQKIINKSIHNETVQWYICPACGKLFVMDYDAEEFNFDNTNITINKKYYDNIPNISIYSLIVLSSTMKCSANHGVNETKDIIAKLPTITREGELKYCEINASYCSICKRFTILKEDFNLIKDVVICKVIDETVDSKSISNNDIEIEQKKSILYNYGYNVQSKIDLSDKQRHIILSSVIEAEILNRRQITDHLTTLIERGSKRPNWKDATDKWKQDKHFVESYNRDKLPSIIFDKIVLRYTTKSE